MDGGWWMVVYLSLMLYIKGVGGFITHIVVKSVLWYTVIVEGAGFGGNDPGDVRSK